MSVAELEGSPWRVGQPRSNYVVANVRAVLSDQVLDDAVVTVTDDRITDITVGGAARGALDGNGMLLIPGIIDVHSDALEREWTPRVGASVPLDFAIGSFDGRVAAAGLTTVFHGAGFREEQKQGVMRNADRAIEMCDGIDDTRSYQVDHRVLFRTDLLSEQAGRAVREIVDRWTDPSPPLVSHEEHTPGQGQYADPEYYKRALIGDYGLTEEQAKERLAEKVRNAEALSHVRDANVAWLKDYAGRGKIRLLGHDPADARDIEILAARNVSVAEFPTSVAAARAARDHQMPVVAGAPNALRGASHSGNVSAGELISLGLVDALASDYLPSALLGAAFTMARSNVLPLPAAIGLITSGPARVAGLPTVGSLAVGNFADLAFVDDAVAAWPRVAMTLRASRHREQQC